MSVPDSWPEVYEYLGCILASDPDAYEWIRQALIAVYGEGNPYALSDADRRGTLSRCRGVVHDLSGVGEVAFDPDVRAVVRRAFAARFAGVVLDGPPWRVTPFEPLPVYADWYAEAVAMF